MSAEPGQLGAKPAVQGVAREKIVAVIPAFNEAATIGGVVESLRTRVDEVIVVNDASRDETAALAEQAGAIVLTNATNAGYDGSLNRGMAEAMGRGATIAMTFDADGEHPAELVPEILGPLFRNEADVVIAQRPFTVHTCEKLFAVYTNARFSIRDPLCGLKAYRRGVYERFGGFDTLSSIGTELTLRAARAGYRVRSVPIPRLVRQDTSRFYSRRLRANWRIFKAMCRVAAAVR